MQRSARVTAGQTAVATAHQPLIGPTGRGTIATEHVARTAPAQQKRGDIIETAEKLD